MSDLGDYETKGDVRRSDVAAIDSTCTAYEMMQFGNNWKFTRFDKEQLMVNLDGLREMITQMSYHDPRNDRHAMDEWYFYLSRIAIIAMIMYLSGTLEKVETQDE